LNTDAARLFERMPGASLLYEAIEAAVTGSFKNVDIKVCKTQVSFYSNKSFAYVWLPIRKMKNRPDTYIVLSFGLDNKIENPRIVESAQPRPNRYIHHILIEKAEDIDGEIMSWLELAYEFAQRP